MKKSFVIVLIWYLVKCKSKFLTLGLPWDKKEDKLMIEIPEYREEIPVTKRSIISHLGKMYHLFGIVSPTMAEGKRVFREVCGILRLAEL